MKSKSQLWKYITNTRRSHCGMDVTSLWRPLWAEADWSNVFHPVTPQGERGQSCRDCTPLSGLAWAVPGRSSQVLAHHMPKEIYPWEPRTVAPCRAPAASWEGWDLVGALRAGFGEGTPGAPSTALWARTGCTAGHSSLHDPPGILYWKGAQLCNCKEIILDTEFWLPVGPTYKYSLWIYYKAQKSSW